MVSSGFFMPSHCAVFEEDLLYLFYGRPAYRRAEYEQIRLTAKSPVVLVLSPGIVSSGRRMFPFDSGAFEERYKKKWVHHGMKLADFELECPGDAPQRHVAAFFGTNWNYLRQICADPPLPYVGEFEVEALMELLRDPNAIEADDRRLALELQVGNPLPFDSQSVVAMVCADELEGAPWMKAFLSGAGAGIKLLPYELAPLRNGSHYQALLEERAAKFQEEQGLA